MHKNLPLLLVCLLFASCGKEEISPSDYVTSTTSSTVNTFAGSGSAGSVNGTGSAASFYLPAGLAADGSGDIFVADYGNNLIREISPGGVVTTLAGSGAQGSANGTAATASFFNPIAVAVDGSGNVYVADHGNNLIRKISAAGVVSTLAGSGAPGSTNGTGTAASFYLPTSVAVDASGNVYVADYGNNLIRKITAAGVVTTLAGSSLQGFVNGTGTAALFYSPRAVAVDGLGNVYVGDYGNNAVRKISPAGVVTTLAGSGSAGSANGTGTAASFNGITGIALDYSANVYVADYNNAQVREITPNAVVSTFVSGNASTGTYASFSTVYGIALDASANVYISDYSGDIIQKLVP